MSLGSPRSHLDYGTNYVVVSLPLCHLKGTPPLNGGDDPADDRGAAIKPPSVFLCAPESLASPKTMI